MVKRPRQREQGSLMVELVAALAILMAGVLPLTFVYSREQTMALAQYRRAVAIEIVDGEMEVLRAGEWRAYSEGVHPYKSAAAATRNLPAGQFRFTRTGQQLRLEWLPTDKAQGGVVRRETGGQ